MTYECSLTVSLGNYLFQDVHILRLHDLVPSDMARLMLSTRNAVQSYHNSTSFNPLTPNDPYRGLTAPLTSNSYILYTYSTNIGTEYFKHGIYSPFFPLQNAVCFISLTYSVPVLLAFYIQCVLKLKKK